jgi:3-oxoacyl-(acyl-carrier-protein) synthase
MNQKIAITAIASISALGKNSKTIWRNYLSQESFITSKDFNGKDQFVAAIPDDIKLEINQLRKSDSKYRSLDNSVLFAILTSREAIAKAGWKASDDFGINIGSSRGATELFEKYHQEFLETGKTSTLASPTSTLGNISTWVAHDLQTQGPEISHSITCSTALHALLNGVAWLQAGMATKFLVGGSEAPLTAFTIAQMQALKIYSKEASNYKCQALNFNKKTNTMVLGEGAAMACLELGEHENALCYVEGIGYATDTLKHSISISEEAECFQKSMKMALQNTNYEDVDVIIMHAPGTIKGDLSEYKAIEKLFPKKLPLLTTNKWKIGHTLGASGLLSVELVIMMLQNQEFVGIPYLNLPNQKKVIKKVLINAVGFGGNAVSVLLSI